MAEQATAKSPEIKMLNALRRSAAASLAGGMIAASGRAHTSEEAITVLNEVYKALGAGGKRARRAAR
ncbi:MAG TPA: hypothetical protein VFE13_04395 [Caulobacteraceae bacterium]|jgi:hypothetical protein|nr:hypothetical protein [Caulobacteraceae bacterium]